MSLQDDYYDLEFFLKSNESDENNLLPALRRIWFAYCLQEAKQMLDDGELSEESYDEWLKGLH